MPLAENYAKVQEGDPFLYDDWEAPKQNWDRFGTPVGVIKYGELGNLRTKWRSWWQNHQSRLKLPCVIPNPLITLLYIVRTDRGLIMLTIHLRIVPSLQSYFAEGSWNLAWATENAPLFALLKNVFGPSNPSWCQGMTYWFDLMEAGCREKKRWKTQKHALTCQNQDFRG